MLRPRGDTLLLFLTCLMLQMFSAYGRANSSYPSKELVVAEKVIEVGVAGKTAPIPHDRHVTAKDIHAATPSGKQVTVESSTHAVRLRRKRGIFSGLLQLTALTTKITATGLTIAGAVTDGCVYYPSICKNKRYIERLDGKIRDLKKQFQKKFDRNRLDYLKVREATNFNKEILYYLNDTFQQMNSISEIEDDINNLFMAQLPKLHQMFITNNTDAESYLDQTMSPLQYRLEDLTNMIQQTKKNALVGLAVQYLLEIVLGQLVNTFTTSFNNVQYDVDSVEGFRFFMKEVMGVDEEALENYTQETKDSWKQTNKVKNPSRWQKLKASVSWQKTKQRFKFSGKVLKDLGLRLNKYVKVSLPRKARLWWRVLPMNNKGTWKGFKGKFNHEFIKPLKMKMSNLKTKLASPIKTLRGVKLGWTGKFVTTLGVIGDAVSIAMQVNQWHNVANQMGQAKTNYEYYHGNLTREVNLSDKEYENLTLKWDEQVSQFPKIVSSLTWFLKNITDYEEFVLLDNSTAAHLPVDISMALFHTDLDDVTRDNLISKQKVVLDAIIKFNQNFTQIKNEVYSRYIFYSHITKTLNDTWSNGMHGEPVSDILKSLKVVFSFQAEQVQEYGTQLVEFDVLCAIAILFPDMPTFDFFPLKQFRPSCMLDRGDFTQMQKKASKERFRAILLDTVQAMSIQNKPVTDILDQVKRDYNNKGGEYSKYGSALGERDVVCAIAEVLPTKSDYKFYNLEDFRPTCPSQAEFDTLKEAVDKVKAAYDTIESIVTTLKILGISSCTLDLQTLADANNMPVEKVKLIIKEVDPTFLCSK